MPSSSRPRRLPGNMPFLDRVALNRSCRLWLDGDTLVQARSQLFAQEIERFRLRDIQAIQVRRTAEALGWNIAWGVIIALLAVLLLGTGISAYRLGYAAFFILPFVVLLTVNLVLGPTCRALLLTNVGEQPLPSLRRLRPTRRALGEITAAIEAVQGALPPDQGPLEVDRWQARFR